MYVCFFSYVQVTKAIHVFLWVWAWKFTYSIHSDKGKDQKQSKVESDTYHKEEASDWQLRYLLLTLQLLAHHHVAGKHGLLVCNSWDCSETQHLARITRTYCYTDNIIISKENSAYKPSDPWDQQLSLVSVTWSNELRSISSRPWMGCLARQRVIPSINLASNHLYTWVERDTVRVKCLAQERNTMSPVRAWNRTARSE